MKKVSLHLVKHHQNEHAIDMREREEQRSMKISGERESSVLNKGVLSHF